MRSNLLLGLALPPLRERPARTLRFEAYDLPEKAESDE
jgi:hypothetical protein